MFLRDFDGLENRDTSHREKKTIASGFKERNGEQKSLDCESKQPETLTQNSGLLGLGSMISASYALPENTDKELIAGVDWGNKYAEWPRQNLLIEPFPRVFTASLRVKMAYISGLPAITGGSQISMPNLEIKPREASITSFASSIPVLKQPHVDEMHASGISDEVLKTSGVRTVSGEDACGMLGWSEEGNDVSTGWAIPFDDPSKENCYWRVKLDTPRIKEGREIKYESPVGTSNRAYFPPGFDKSDGTRFIITEGEKKALCAITNGINCIGLTGCWNWQKPRKRDDDGRAYGSRQLIDDLNELEWTNRDVVICFDSDIVEKESVAMAEQKLVEVLAIRGANVRVARIPSGPNDKKLGLDDAIVELGIDSVKGILEAAEVPETPDFTWLDKARLFIEEEFSYLSEPTVRYWRDTPWKWNGRHYGKMSKEELSNAAYRFMDSRGWNANRNRAAELVKAVEVETEVESSIDPPCYLDRSDTDIPGTPLVFDDQVVFVDFDDYYTGAPYTVAEASPTFFCTGSRDYSWDPAATCPTWEEFLESSLPDFEERYFLQQWFGYLLSGRMDHQKLLILVGAKRAGKSIIANVMSKIVGDSATATSSLGALGENFGLWPLLDKQLLLIPDAQDRGSCISAVERLKAITGCDGLIVDRKFLPALSNVHLKTRVVITCNQLPRFLDPSGALHNRTLLLNFQQSFAGREDRSLAERIKAEMPGILNWALVGWENLNDYGGFVTPPSSEDLLKEAEETFSPINAFLAECCDEDASYKVPVNDVWKAWQEWSKSSKYQCGNIAKMGADLRGARPSLERKQLRCNGSQTYHYVGIKLNLHGETVLRQYASAMYRHA